MFQLKLLQLSDAHEFFLVIEKNRGYLRDWLPWLDTTKTQNDCEQYILQCLKLAALGLQRSYKILVGHQLVGIIDIRDMTNQSATVGYWVTQNYQGRGLVSSALKNLIQGLKNDPKIDRLILRAEPANIASQKVALACGFQRMTVLKAALDLYGRKTDLIVFELDVSN